MINIPENIKYEIKYTERVEEALLNRQGYDIDLFWSKFYKNIDLNSDNIYEVYSQLDDNEIKYLFKYNIVPELLIEQVARSFTSQNKNLYFIYTTQDISERFITKYKNSIDIPLMLITNKRLNRNTAIKYTNSFNWYCNSTNCFNLWFSRRYKEFIEWNYFSIIIPENKLTDKFIDEFKEYLDLYTLVKAGKLSKERSEQIQNGSSEESDERNHAHLLNLHDITSNKNHSLWSNNYDGYKEHLRCLKF